MNQENNRFTSTNTSPLHSGSAVSEVENSTQKKPEEAGAGSFVMEIIKFTIISILIVAPIRFFIAQPFIVRGESMYPSFKDGQYLIIDEITYRRDVPERGDVIVFKYPKDTSKYFIKRIIGLPNEKIQINNGIVTVSSDKNPEGKILSEEYIKSLSFENTSETLGPNEYFVMGDNRSNSLDSRMWGPLPTKNIVGRVIVRLFPFHDVGLFPAKQTQ